MKKTSTMKSVKKPVTKKTVSVFAATKKAYNARKAGSKFEPSVITAKVRSDLGKTDVKHATVVRYLNELGAVYNYSLGKFVKQ